MTKNPIKANAVMTQKYICMDGMQTIREAIDAMKKHDSKVIIVNKRDQHDAYGILVLSDIAKQVLAKDRSPDRVNIYEVMAKPIVSVPPEMDIRYCARLFERFGLSHAPVIENEGILGLIGYKELVLHELEN
ncbi:CBS domain-containing protein [Moritella sp. Urea-trap-13]|uniref:CBS domain-containing protein n=1 Tax=Moritella sp. Urea-trap-13 TaxID=2058327 RepID=UPI000C31D7EE|nr:CBS domain-containing protein [Moritella sp. Urea-trap-13]PKH06766.1 histidine kinase [Moritella sp. Urea-trap-13]